MKSANLQFEVFKSIVNQERRIGYQDLGERVALTRDGMTAFAIPKNQCFIDLSKLRQLPNLTDLFSLGENDKEIHKTKIEASFENAPSPVLKLKGEGFNVWCRKSWFMKYYTGQPLYCSGTRCAIKFFDSIHKEVEAVILPVLINEAELDK